jgi:hypothetical protein
MGPASHLAGPASRKGKPMSVPKISIAVARVQSLVIPLKGQWTVSVAQIVKFVAPQAMHVLAISVVARVKGGTISTMTFDVQLANGTSLLTTPLDMNAASGTRIDGVLNTTYSDNVPAQSELHVDLVVNAGAGPTLDDVSLQIDYVPID